MTDDTAADLCGAVVIVGIVVGGLWGVFWLVVSLFGGPSPIECAQLCDKHPSLMSYEKCSCAEARR